MTADIKQINDISYFIEDSDSGLKKVTGVIDDRTGFEIERIGNGNISMGGCVIPESLANNLMVAWLLISDPDIISEDELTSAKLKTKPI